VPELRSVPPARASNKYVRFFLASNPHFARGDELACITKIAHDNIKPLGEKLLMYEDVKWDL